ncbi:alpha/beta fold hydrolase [Mycolicibacterium celeriflavum]|uniref:alpha/beta fold hydrolase n=1 Tax=Mycolicibacterium celeriflavum TaxID=1249101 RepID=UPI003CECDBA5
MLFVHIGAWSFVWRDVLRCLEADFRCIAVDAPGSGFSERMSTPPTLEHATTAVTDVIDALDLRNVMLVAHDLGGPAGFAAATRRADRVASLAAVNCFAWKPTGSLFRGMLAVMGSAGMREIDAATGFFPRMTSSRFGVGRHWGRDDRAVFRAGIDGQARRAWHGYFRDARCAGALYDELETGLRGVLADKPLLTVFGERNDPLGFQKKWKARYPDADQVVVPGGYHFPMCDDPHLVASALAAFARR